MSRELFETMTDVMDVKPLAEDLQISKAGAYNLLNSPDFPTLRIGGRKLVMKNELVEGIVSGDSDLVIKGNVVIQRVFGRELQFINQKEFDDLMKSDIPLELCPGGMVIDQLPTIHEGVTVRAKPCRSCKNVILLSYAPDHSPGDIFCWLECNYRISENADYINGLLAAGKRYLF